MRTHLGSAVVCVSIRYVINTYTRAFFAPECAEIIVKYVLSQGTYVANYIHEQVQVGWCIHTYTTQTTKHLKMFLLSLAHSIGASKNAESAVNALPCWKRVEFMCMPRFREHTAGVHTYTHPPSTLYHTLTTL